MYCLSLYWSVWHQLISVCLLVLFIIIHFFTIFWTETADEDYLSSSGNSLMVSAVSATSRLISLWSAGSDEASHSLNCSRHLNRGQRHCVLLPFPLLLCCRMLDKVLGTFTCVDICLCLWLILVNLCLWRECKRKQRAWNPYMWIPASRWGSGWKGW